MFIEEIRRLGDEHVIVVPDEVVAALGLREGQPVAFTLREIDPSAEIEPTALVAIQQRGERFREDAERLAGDEGITPGE
jgi:bifunctional DNA-binding transcriptional regulator/antitoxin component of YhaV-PrlF toxin-antitoxin module